MTAQVKGIANGIAASDVQNGINPADDPRLQVISSLSGRVQGLSAVQTPGHDRLLRTNDVVGIGVVVDF